MDGGEKYPDFVDALVPMASEPSAMSSRNWMMRRLIADSIRNDPDWKNGDYTSQPRSAQFASVSMGVLGRLGSHSRIRAHSGRRLSNQFGRC
jgi:homoserine O-acetyltransferase/O-succinyltransferase